MSHVDDNHAVGTLSQKLKKETGVSVARCYQCGKCTAGCPLGDEMDYPPSHILRLLQVGTDKHDDTVLRAASLWVCLTCETCYARCPQEVEITKMMDFLRAESVRQKKVNPRAKNILAFHRSFIDSIRLTGKLYELGMIADYKARSWQLFQDVLIAPKLFLLGKLKLFPHWIHDRKNLKRLFKKSDEALKEAGK